MYSAAGLRLQFVYNNILTLTSFSLGTRFEQYKNVYFTPGIDLSFDDLRVDSSASDNLKKQADELKNSSRSTPVLRFRQADELKNSSRSTPVLRFRKVFFAERSQQPLC